MSDENAFHPFAIEKRARARLYPEARLAPEDPAHSDHAIAGMNPDGATLASARPAAVLVPWWPGRRA